MSMLQGILYEEDSAWLFLLVTVVMGGWAGWMAARGIARGWRPFWKSAHLFSPELDPICGVGRHIALS